MGKIAHANTFNMIAPDEYADMGIPDRAHKNLGREDALFTILSIFSMGETGRARKTFI